MTLLEPTDYTPTTPTLTLLGFKKSTQHPEMKEGV